MIYVFFYINYLNNSDKCSKLINKHIRWDWSDSNWNFYTILIFNSYLLFTNKYNKLVVILSAIS